MILVIDSNIVFAALLRNGVTRELLIDSPFILYAPETLLLEIQKYKQEIVERSGLSEQEFYLLFALITEKIEVVAKEEYAHKLEEANNLIGLTDKGDVPFLALALSTLNNGIWTENTKHFKQEKVKIWSTTELINTIQNVNAS